MPSPSPLFLFLLFLSLALAVVLVLVPVVVEGEAEDEYGDEKWLEIKTWRRRKAGCVVVGVGLHMEEAQHALVILHIEGILLFCLPVYPCK